MASHFNTCIITDYKDEGIRFHFGIPSNGKIGSMSVSDYIVENHIGKYENMKENKVDGITEGDLYCWKVKNREIYELGDEISFHESHMFIYAIRSVYEKGELVNYYVLKPKGGFKVKHFYNLMLIGASLDAKILDVAKDTVKAHILTDLKQDVNTAKWFPYSTVYSSPDGTGWYCMPEKGDSVRLYFPNEKEEEGYIISSIHLQSTGTKDNAPRSNPDNKSISTKYNKEVELTPSSITVTNHKGMTIKLDDNEGIQILSDKKICMESEDEISIASTKGNMHLEAMEGMELKQGSTKLTIKDDIKIEGAKFHVQ